MFDTLASFRHLVESGLPEKQAEAYVAAIFALNNGQYDKETFLVRFKEAGFTEKQADLIASTMRDLASDVRVMQ